MFQREVMRNNPVIALAFVNHFHLTKLKCGCNVVQMETVTNTVKKWSPTLSVEITKHLLQALLYTHHNLKDCHGDITPQSIKVNSFGHIVLQLPSFSEKGYRQSIFCSHFEMVYEEKRSWPRQYVNILNK